LGKKPLYLAFCNETLFWSSEITPLRNLSTENKINVDFVDEYLSLGYLLDPTSPIKGVTSMLPGQILTFSTENHKKPMNSILEKPRPAKSLAEQDIRETIFTAVKQRIEGHKSVALSLSGGLDSTIIGILLSEMDVEVNAYSVNWPDSDKSRYNTDALVAEKIANKLGINFVKVDMVDASHITSELDKFISIMQEPNNNPSGLSMNKLYSEISKRGDRLVLTGDGSDEIFGGYQRYSSAVKIPKIFSFNGRLIEQSLLFNKTSPMRQIGNLANSQINPNNISTWLNWHMVFNPREINELLFSNHKSTEVLDSLKLKIKSIMSNPEYINRTESIMDRDQNIWLTMESNRKLDRISMAYSIEARSPFQDDNVVYCATREMKEKEFKKLDKEILKSVFPELRELGVRTDKAGFTSPVGHWLRNNDLLVRESLNDLVKSGMFDADRLNQFNDVPLRGKYRELMQLWTLVVLARYLKQNRNE
jgi:asparagine synthase (glutamine-hydrolysing)